MRILMNTDTLGGVWNYSATLVGELSRNGDDVALVTAGKPMTREQRKAVATLPRVHVVETTNRLEWMEGCDGDLQDMAETLLEMEAVFRPEVVHLNDYVFGSLPWQAPTIVVGHSCVLSWSEAVLGEPAGDGWASYRRRVQAGLLSSSLVVSPSRWMLDQLVRLYGPLGSARVIHNGYEDASPPRAPKQQLVFAAGRIWDEGKGMRVLADAAPKIAWPIWIAGDSTNPEGRGRTVLTQVRALGQLTCEQMRSAYTRASIFALPAKYEPFGLTALEAANCGCALVLADIPSLREVWDDAAVYVGSHDAGAWAETLNAVIADPALLRTLQLAAKERAKRYSAAAMTERYRMAYRSLVESRAEEEMSCAS